MLFVVKETYFKILYLDIDFKIYFWKKKMDSNLGDKFVVRVDLKFYIQSSNLVFNLLKRCVVI